MTITIILYSIGDIFGMIVSFLLACIVIGGGTWLIYALGAYIGNKEVRDIGRQTIATPDSLPNLIRGISNGSKKIFDRIKNQKVIQNLYEGKIDSKLNFLEKLSDLKKEGILNDEEFEQLKQEILNK